MLERKCMRAARHLATTLCLILAAPTISVAAHQASTTVIPLRFIQKIPFVQVVVGDASADLMFDSGGQLGITLQADLIKQAGSVTLLEHKTKHGDASGNVYEVQDMIASKVLVGNLSLGQVKGSVHYDWGLGASSDNAGQLSELKEARKTGTIGLAAFAPRPLLIDFAHRELTVYQPGGMPDLNTPGWRSLALKYDEVGPQVVLTLLGRPTKFILDTGATNSFLEPGSLDPEKFPTLCKDKPEGSNYCGHMDLLDIQDQNKMPIGVLPVELVEMKGVPFDGLLGADFFVSHFVFIDFAKKLVWIKAN